jgi:hypothetical protein
MKILPSAMAAVMVLVAILPASHAQQTTPRDWPSDRQKQPSNPDTPPPATKEAAPSSPQATGVQGFPERLAEAVKAFDDGALAKLLDEAIQAASAKGDAESQLLAAKCYLARCDLRRFMRKSYDLEKKRDKELRNEDATLAAAGLVYAEKAVALAPNSSEAERVTGELYIHQITGPIAGFRYGPKGRQHIEKAIELDPRSAEARRAIGLMYLYNPSINGGDPDKAAKTFDNAIELGGDDRCYVLAGRAYVKIKKTGSARLRFLAALKINPKNLEAQELLKQVQGEAPSKR